MKKLIRCVGCKELTAYYKSYKAKVVDIYIAPGVPRSLAQPDNYEGRICKRCAENAGYKTHRKHKKKESTPKKAMLIPKEDE